MAFEQVKFLANSDPIKLYQQARPILEHNYNLIKNSLLNTDKIKNFIQTHIDKL